MKKFHTISFFLLTILHLATPCANAQCSTYIQMVHAVEGCVLPQVVATHELLLPCSAPADLWALNAGDFAYIEYRDTSCNNICQTGHNVIVTCFSLPVATHNPEDADPIKISPTLVQSYVNIEGTDVFKVEIYNDCGVRLKLVTFFSLSTINLDDLSPGIYFIKVFSKTHTTIKKIIRY